MNFEKENYFILSGPPGSGKSSVLQVLKNKGIMVIDEPAREIIAEQRLIGGAGIYEKNPNLFINLMLSRSIYQFKQYLKSDDVIIFDRGIPDFLGYADLAGIDSSIYMNAANVFRYHHTVLHMPFWDAIYVNDDERKMSADNAEKYGHMLEQGYDKANYKRVDVPFASIESRADFILKCINVNHKVN